MGTIANILQDWSSSDSDKTALYASQKGIVVRWLNEAQLQFSDKSECLRDVWEPTITSTGNVALPSNFKREIKDRVKWDSSTYLTQIDYSTANLITSWGSTTHYSIWGNTFYVWGATAGTPQIPYIKKPTAITIATISTADLDIPTEYHSILMLYLDSMYARRQKDISGSLSLLKQFNNFSDDAYNDYIRDNDPVPKTRGGFF